jgi:hypothetical protein
MSYGRFHGSLLTRIRHLFGLKFQIKERYLPQNLFNMKTTLFLLLLLLINFSVAFAQTEADTAWRKTFDAGLILNQAAFSDNWKAGGISSIALNSHLNARADYVNGRISWDNEVQLQYGFLKNKDEDQRKSIDRIYLDTKYGYAISSDWNAFFSINFLSQFTKGYEYDIDAAGTDRLISNFLSPGFLTFAIGAEYKPNPYFWLRLSPFAPRLTFLTDDAVGENERYGVPEGKRVRTEWWAAMIQASYTRDLMPNVNLKLNYLAYINYQELSAKKIDHIFNAGLTAKVNDYINVSLLANLIYDYDQDTAVQYNQSLGLGILYTMNGYTLR